MSFLWYKVGEWWELWRSKRLDFDLEVWNLQKYLIFRGENFRVFWVVIMIFYKLFLLTQMKCFWLPKIFFIFWKGFQDVRFEKVKFALGQLEITLKSFRVQTFSFFGSVIKKKLFSNLSVFAEEKIFWGKFNEKKSSMRNLYEIHAKYLEKC